jgi:mannose-6-phosphate isomerase-like protein (cupin superfamily)
MSKMVIEKGFFSTKDEVMQDIRKSGYWPTTFISGKSPELPVHYHSYDILGYVMEGETYILDEDGKQCPVGPGDRLVIPKGAWHAEGEVKEKVVYIVTVSEAVPLLDAIMPLEARGPFPPPEMFG